MKSFNCGLFNCDCYDRIVLWQRKLDEWIADPGPVSELIKIMPSMFITLKCIEQHCPDRAWRRAATIELLHPVWNNLPKEFRS